jgi:hypothetical protein
MKPEITVQRICIVASQKSYKKGTIVRNVPWQGHSAIQLSLILTRNLILKTNIISFLELLNTYTPCTKSMPLRAHNLNIYNLRDSNPYFYREKVTS